MVCELRRRYALSALGLFAVSALSIVSFSIGGLVVPPHLAAALLWLVLFFSAMAGLARTFVQEAETGTLMALRLYAHPQVVLFGKMLFNLLLMWTVTALVLPLFVLFLNIDVFSLGMIFVVFVLGIMGIAAAATLTAGMVVRAQGQGALFTVITFPVLLPVLLMNIHCTATLFGGALPAVPELAFLAAFDAAWIVGGSLLFDYLWQE